MKKVLIWAFAAAVVLTLGGALWVRQSVPSFSGQLHFAELSAKVTVRRDEAGIPHIEAGNDRDAYFALGYVQAQDRLFQLDFVRRVASGRLSEWFGAKTLEQDRRMRTLGLSAWAKAALERGQPQGEPRAAIVAYIRGINAFVEHGKRPLELRLLGVPAEPFSEADALSSLALSALGFAYALKADPLYTVLLEELGAERLNSIWPNFGSDEGAMPRGARAIEDATKHTSTDRAKDEHTRQLLADFAEQLLQGAPYALAGSNSWVVAPARTEKGAAMLANDPHIAFATPSVFYEAHLVTPKLDLFGELLPLVPFFVLGHKRELAWGLTMYENDDMDLYRETLRGDSAAWHGEFEPLGTRREEITVRGEASTVLIVRSTRHGPLISDTFTDLPSSAHDVALKWAMLRQGNDPLAALFNLNHATDLPSFRAGLHGFGAPGLNILYADKSGHTALFARGVLPRRSGFTGQKILSGSGDNEWSNEVPESEWPEAIDPPRGFLVAANNPPLVGPLPTSHGPYRIEGYFHSPARADRISDYLASHAKISLDDFSSLQNDTKVTPAQHFLSALLPLVPSGQEFEYHQERALLAKWDQRADEASTAAALFYAWQQAWAHAVFGDELGEARFATFSTLPQLEWAEERVLSDLRHPFWDDVSTEVKETPAQIAERSFVEAVRHLRELGGSADPARWRWGPLHTLEFRHPLARGDSRMAWLFDLGPHPMPGGPGTVASFLFGPSHGFSIAAGPSSRRLIDFSNPTHLFAILPTGNSGQRVNPHYSDQSRLFIEGRYRNVSLERDDIVARQNGVLELLP